MADVSSPQQPESLVYRPISLVALAGFVLAALFAALVVVCAVVALFQGMPMFLPGWAQVLAVSAAVVCLLAQIHIRNAEGTLAGQPLARWGLGLSVLLGVSYFVYSWVTGLALAQQANDFLMVKSDEVTGFFPCLRNADKYKKDFYQAFLFSLPQTLRGGSKASEEKSMLIRFDQPSKDGEPGRISKFHKNSTVAMLMKYRDKVTIEPLSIVDWNYEKNAYQVVRIYRFTTPEMVVEMPLVVQSTEGASEGEQRTWFIKLNDFRDFRPPPVKLTILGQDLKDYRGYSKAFLERWRMQLSDGTPAPQYRESDTDWSEILPNKETREQVKKMLAEVFRAQASKSARFTFLTDLYFGDWKNDTGRLLLFHPCKLILPAGDSGPGYKLELEFVVASKRPVDLTVPLGNGAPPEWEIQKIRLVKATRTAGKDDD